jgi:uncharacterized membrane protein
MLAIIAAVLFAIAAILTLIPPIAILTPLFITFIGLCLLSLHVAGIMARRR